MHIPNYGYISYKKVHFEEIKMKWDIMLKGEKNE